MQPETPLPPPAAQLAPSPRAFLLGTAFGLSSAVIYTAANIALRSVTEVDAMWVATVKALPIVLLMGPWVVVHLLRSQTVLPSLRILGLLLLGATVDQFGGNVLFQWALGAIGIALTVPLVLGMIIIGGAVLSRLLLGEPISRRTSVSIAILIAAVCSLGLAARLASADAPAATGGSDAAPTGRIALGVAAAIFSGLSYSVLGVVLRHALSQGTPVATGMTIVGLVGVLGLGGVTHLRIGEQMWATAPADLRLMLLAGVCNAVAFLALNKALQLTAVVHVNMLSASQSAMAAVAGILLFREPVSAPLVVGVALTILGLSLRRGGRRGNLGEVKAAPPADDSEAGRELQAAVAAALPTDDRR